MSEQMKTCTKCGEVKALEEFSTERRSPDGKRTWCRLCGSKDRREYYWQNRKSQLERGRDYRRRNREKYREYADDYHRTKQTESRYGARSHGKEWTGPELELAGDPSRSTAEVAHALGRTFYAVKKMRCRLRTYPRKIKVAGIPERGEP